MGETLLLSIEAASPSNTETSHQLPSNQPPVTASLLTTQTVFVRQPVTTIHAPVAVITPFTKSSSTAPYTTLPVGPSWAGALISTSSLAPMMVPST